MENIAFEDSDGEKPPGDAWSLINDFLIINDTDTSSKDWTIRDSWTVQEESAGNNITRYIFQFHVGDSDFE